MSNHLKFFTTHPPFRVSDSAKVELIRKELHNILKHQERLHEMDTDYALESAVSEAVGILDNFLDWEPPDDELCGEPAMTMVEIHSGAWNQHLQLHS